MVLRGFFARVICPSFALGNRGLGFDSPSSLRWKNVFVSSTGTGNIRPQLRFLGRVRVVEAVRRLDAWGRGIDGRVSDSKFLCFAREKPSSTDAFLSVASGFRSFLLVCRSASFGDLVATTGCGLGKYPSFGGGAGLISFPRPPRPRVLLLLLLELFSPW